MADENNQEEDLYDKLVENALAPKRVRTDSGEVEQHYLSDQLKVVKDAVRRRKGSLLNAIGVYQVVNEGDVQQ